MRYLTVVMIGFAFLTAACAATMEGKKIDPAQTKNLLAEGTTSEDVVKMFGKPQAEEKLASGETKYVYYYRTQGRILFFRNAKPRDEQVLEVIVKDNQVDRYRFRQNDQDPVTTDIPPILPDRK